MSISCLAKCTGRLKTGFMSSLPPTLFPHIHRHTHTPTHSAPRPYLLHQYFLSHLNKWLQWVQARTNSQDSVMCFSLTLDFIILHTNRRGFEQTGRGLTRSCTHSQNTNALEKCRFVRCVCMCVLRLDYWECV